LDRFRNFGTKVTFNSTVRYHTGAKSISVNAWAVNDVFQLAKGSNLACTGYDSITMWINPDRRWITADVVEMYGWDVTTGLQVGNAVDLKNYFTYNIYDTWHKLTIPLSDFGSMASSTINAIRFRYVVTSGGLTEFFIDDMQFEAAAGTGEPIEFKIEPDKGTWLHVEALKFIMADAYTGIQDVADASENQPFLKLPYNTLLGVAKLTTGITYKRVQAGEIISSAQIQQLLDAMSFSNAEITGSGSDGTNTWLTVQINFTEPVILKAEDLDYMSFTINDDMSGLLEFKAVASSKVEERN